MMKYLVTIVAASALAVLAGCARQAEGPVANADAIADNLEARADALEMQADNSANSDAAIAMENLSDTLDETAANVREATDSNSR